MKQLNVLIVEDEMIVAMEIKNYLQQLDCNVVAMVTNGEDAIDAMESYSVDLILMDIYLEGALDGVESAKIIKELKPSVEIIFVSANSDDINFNRVAHLLPIAYLSKPFNRQELYVAIMMIRAKGKQEREIVLDEEFSYNKEHQLLYANGKVVKLTKKEKALLSILIDYQDQVVSFVDIEFLLWSDKVVTSNTLRSLVRRLREKLKYRFIKTHATQGYRFTLN